MDYTFVMWSHECETVTRFWTVLTNAFSLQWKKKLKVNYILHMLWLTAETLAHLDIIYTDKETYTDCYLHKYSNHHPSQNPWRAITICLPAITFEHHASQRIRFEMYLALQKTHRITFLNLMYTQLLAQVTRLMLGLQSKGSKIKSTNTNAAVQ